MTTTKQARACPPLNLRNGTTLDDPLDAALNFVEKDGSYRAYDLAPVVADDHLTEPDVRAANRIIARMGTETIALILTRRTQVEAALRQIPLAASLTDDERLIPWTAIGSLLGSLDGLRGVRLPRITKVLHKKRPGLLPILDSVVEQYLVGVEGPVEGLLVERGVELTRRYKRELDATLDTISCVKASLADRGVHLTECRLLDIYLWALSGTYEPLYQRGRGPRQHQPSRPASTPRTLPLLAGVHLFKDDDDAYLRWVATHPGGYVLNCARTPTPGYLKIHRADCTHIVGIPTRGARWTDKYIKVCSTSIPTLRQWAEGAIGGQTTDCGLCVSRRG